MREVRQNWLDLFLGFRIALDLRKMFLGLVVILITLIVGSLAFLALMAAVIEDQKAKARANVATAELESSGQIRQLQRDIAAIENQYPDGNMPRDVRQDLDAKNDRLHTLQVAANYAAIPPFIDYAVGSTEKDNPESTLFGMIGGSIGGNETDKGRLGNTMRLTLADLGIGTFEHPTEPIDYLPSGITAFKASVFVVAGLIWWFFVSRQLGAISRIAAVEVARDVRLELGKASAFAKDRATSLFWAPVAIDLLFAGLFLGIWIWAFLAGQVYFVGPILATVTAPLVLFAGFLMAIVVLGGGFGFPLIVPAIAVEGTDVFDALSRSFSYVFSRPWHYLWYFLVNVVYGTICIAFVWFFTLLILALAAWPARLAWGEPFEKFLAFIFPQAFIDWIPGAPATPVGHAIDLGEIFQADPTLGIFSFVGLLGVIFIVGMALAYAVSYKCTMWTLTYYLLRHRVDGTDVTEIFYDEDDEFWVAPPTATEATIAATATRTAGEVGRDQAAQTATTTEAPLVKSGPAATTESESISAESQPVQKAEPAPEQKPEQKPAPAPEQKPEPKPEPKPMNKPKPEPVPAQKSAPPVSGDAEIISSSVLTKPGDPTPIKPPAPKQPAPESKPEAKKDKDAGKSGRKKNKKKNKKG